jgi:hypothetical protein
MEGGKVRRRAVRTGLLIQLLLVSSAVWAGSALAEPVSGPHETIDQQFTTTQPNAPSGFSFDGTYHAAGDPGTYPPYMRRMISYNPPGLRFDTSVPERCSASDIELAAFGAAACPAGSRLGGGTTSTSFLGGPPSTTEVDFFNNTNEQIILARSPVLATVARGQIHPDGSVEFASPTCFPSLQPLGCPVDTVLQLSSSITVPPYTRPSDGIVRSWLTTPPKCPRAGHWQTRFTLWWADGSVDTVVTRQPCKRSRSSSR